MFEERPTTPPEVRKYRRSTNLEPGRRFQHHGMVDDYRQMNLDDKIYGITDSTSKHGAADLINHSRDTELQRVNNIKAEKVYRHLNREPLGRQADKNYQLPLKFTEGNQAFGIGSKSSLEPAKNLIFPADQDMDSAESEELYKRSHGSYAPGEQRRRDYQWNLDPEQTRFGQKGDTIALNGVSQNIADVLNASLNVRGPVANTKKVEDFRNMGDMLGKSKNLGQNSAYRPKDLVYGKASGVKGLSAAEVIKGYYTDHDTLPDDDLGKSITPGFRNLAYSERSYGCPSIRSDIPAPDPTKRSLADAQNYGDDVPAQDLINPPAFADLAIGPLTMNEPQSKSRIRALFERIGYELSDEVFEALYEQAARPNGSCTANAFRDALNRFILDNELRK